jgi:hypothetical protein
VCKLSSFVEALHEVQYSTFRQIEKSLLFSHNVFRFIFVMQCTSCVHWMEVFMQFWSLIKGVVCVCRSGVQLQQCHLPLHISLQFWLFSRDFYIWLSTNISWSILWFINSATDFHMGKSGYYSLIKLPIFTCKKVVIVLSSSYRFSHENIPESCLVSLWKYFMILRVYFYSTSPISPWLSQVHDQNIHVFLDLSTELSRIYQKKWKFHK